MAFVSTISATLRGAVPSALTATRCSAKVPSPSSVKTRRAFLTSALAAATAASLSGPLLALAEPQVKIEDVVVGEGKTFSSGTSIKLHYTLTLNDFQDKGGKVVDSSRSRGRPFR